MDTMACFVHRILFLGAVVCITASANLMLEYNWPEPNQNIDRFPHESSCHHYYLMLSEEDISIEKCPDGQLFDYVKHSCISEKEHVHCWSRHFGKIKHDHMHMKHKKHFKCPYPWGKYPNLHDCSKYHLCLNGKSRVKKCAPYELFDKISRKCIASIDAVCADKTDVVEHGYVCPKTWGSFTFSKDCSKYYECLQRKPTVRTCQKGNLFDDRLRKCAPKEHVYCGLRHNPYEKVSSDVPETPSVPSTTVQKSTTHGFDATEKIASDSSDVPETPSVPDTSVPKSTTLGLEATALTPTDKFSEVKPISQDTSPKETSSTYKEVTSTPQETSTIKEVASEQASTDQSTINEISRSSAVTETNNKETKQESSIATENPTVGTKTEEQQKTSDVTEDVSGNEFVEGSSTTEKGQVKVSPQVATEDESDDLKKVVSTEEKDADDVPTNEHPSGSSAATVCLPEDSMCITERDGTVVRCSSSKDLQPHPKDERRFLDCTESKINVYACPPGLTFRPDTKKCRWQFIMSSK